MNEYDSSRMADLLTEKLSIEPTDKVEDADILLINTCSIREKAQEKLFHQLGRWAKHKEKNPKIIICVGGCVASQEGNNIRKRAPYVDVIFGPQTLHRLPEMIRSALSDKKNLTDISFPEIEKFDCLPEPSINGPTAFVSIMEGCSKYCSFCIVPYTRGEEVSRPFDDIISECTSLAEKGVREVNLLGQNVNAYQGHKYDKTMADLAELITYVAAIEGIDRIRFTTSHPVAFSDSLIQAYEDIPELVSHLHLPIQSGSDRILALMKRGHMVLEYKSKIRKLMRIRPNLSLSSDFIIGFPGESEKDFLSTMQVIEEMNFDSSFSFIYSQRPGTPASEILDSTSLEAKKQRLSLVQHRINQQARKISNSLVNTLQKILVLGIANNDPGQMHGRTECNRSVFFRSNNQKIIGKFATILIKKSLPHSLRGEIICSELDSENIIHTAEACSL